MENPPGGHDLQMDPGLWELLLEGSSEDEVAVILRLRDPGQPPPGVRVIARFGPIATVRLRRGDIPATRAHPDVRSAKRSRRYTPEIPIEPIHLPRIHEPPAELIPEVDQRRVEPDARRTGRGVVVGVVDWGCDFAHPDFRREDGSTRLLALWDQRPRVGEPPTNRYGYGRIHTADAIDRALRSADPYAALTYHPADSDTGRGCHGTHTLSIAAGNGRGGGPLGVAPDADLIFVELSTWGEEGMDRLGDSVALLEAVDFIATTAEKAGRPWVVNLSMGRQAGEHDGMTLVEQGLDAAVMEAPGRACVHSTGNYFSRGIHSSGQLRPGERHTLIVDVHATGVLPHEIDIWYEGQDRVVVEVQSPRHDLRSRVELGDHMLLGPPGKPLAGIYHRASDPNNHDNNIDIFIHPGAPPGPWHITLTGEDIVDGRFHAWIERDANCPHCQPQFDPDKVVPTSTTGTICNGFRTIAVGAYNAHSHDRELASFSSSGPTRDGRQKPDLCAPGVFVLAARSAPREPRDGAPLLTRMSGTSMAAPHVTGCIASMFSAAGRPLTIQETRVLLLTSTDKVASDAASALRIGSGYLSIEAAIEAAASYRGETAHEELTMDESVAPLPPPFEAAVEDDPEARGDDRRARARLPIQFQIPIGGGAPALAVPVGGAGSPIAFSVPLGGTTPAPPPPAAAPVVIQTGGTAGPPAPVPEPVVAVTEPPDDPEEMAMNGRTRYADDLVYLANEAVLEGLGKRSGQLMHEVLTRAGAGAVGGRGGHVAAAELFDAFTAVRRPGPRRHFESAFELVASPGQRLESEALRAGDVVIRRALGQGFAHEWIVAVPERWGLRDLEGGRLVSEGDMPGTYVHVVEGGARPHTLADRFARRITDAEGLVPIDTVILRPRPATSSGFESAEVMMPPPPANDFVRWVQRSLNKILGLNLATDGVAGTQTRQAIKRFQGEHSLVVDGVVGSRTEAAIRQALGQPPGRSAQVAPAAVACPPPAAPPAQCQGIGTTEVINCFDFNSAAVLARHQPQIVNLALCIIASQTTATPITTLRLVGHTDSVGSDRDNDLLGQRRADAVKAEILATLNRLTGGRAPAVTIATETRGERDLLPGDPALSRRVEVFPPFAFSPAPPAAAAQIEIVTDDDDDHVVDQRAPVSTFVRFGLWNNAYNAAGDVKNAQAEADNFVGADRRRFYFRVSDPAATGSVTVSWKTVRSDGRTDDDAPASLAITLVETAAGSHVFVSKAVMLVTDETDANQQTHSGFAPPLADAGLRARGQSNHRLRRARFDGFVQAEYRPAAGTPVTVALPVFQRTPTDERRRVPVRVINYGSHVTAAYIGEQFTHANDRWNQIGIGIDAQATVDRPVPAAALDGAGRYAGSANNAFETAALNDLVPITPDNTVTAVFVPLADQNAYATVFERTNVALGDRYFVFVNTGLAATDETLAHEMSHVLWNRGDDATARRFFTLNTNPPGSFGVPLPDPRIYRRIQNLHAPDPDNDASNNNVINWARRRRTARLPIGSPGLGAPTATTGNTLTENL